MKYNTIEGMNNMIMSIFSNESIKNLKLFKQDLHNSIGGSKNFRILHSNKCKIIFIFSSLFHHVLICVRILCNQNLNHRQIVVRFEKNLLPIC